MYSPVHKCWLKTSWAGKWKLGYSSKFRPILATQEPLTAFHGTKQKNKIEGTPILKLAKVKKFVKKIRQKIQQKLAKKSSKKSS